MITPVEEAFTSGMLIGAGIFLPAGYWLRALVIRWRVDTVEFSEFMARIVNTEAADVKRNAMRRELHDAGRRTMRFDGGPPAVVHRMRRRRRVPNTQRRHGNS